MYKKLFIYTLSISMLYACGTEKQDKNVVINMDEKENTEIINELFHSIPPPIELSSLVKKTGYLYHINYLNPVANASKYDMSFQKAVNLGIYATDIAYIHIYNQPQDALNYLVVIKQIADELNIADLLDYSTMQTLLKKEDLDSYDSLINMTTHNFEDINYKLREQGREHISAMIVSGGWIEGFYILNELYQESENPLINEKISEQKFTLAQILILLSQFDENKFLQDLHASLNGIQQTLKMATRVEDEEGNSSWQLTKEKCQTVYDQINSLRNDIIN